MILDDLQRHITVCDRELGGEHAPTRLMVGLQADVLFGRGHA